MNFGARLVAGTVALLALTMAILLSMSDRRMRPTLEREMALGMEREARLVQASLPADPTQWATSIERLARSVRSRISIIAPDGRIIVDSDIPPSRLASTPLTNTLPEVRTAAGGRTGQDVRQGDAGEKILFVAIAAVPMVRLGRNLAAVDDAVHAAQRSILFAALVALVIGVGFAFFAGRSIARPLTALAGAARDIAGGAAPRLPRSGVPEIDALVQAFRRMHAQIEEHFAALRAEREGSEALIDAMTEGVLACDARGRVIRSNPAARRLLGYPPGPALPDLPALFHVKAARELVDASLRGETLVNRELVLEETVVLLNARPLPEGGTVIVLHDISAIRRLEVVRRDFVANVSHELKTPLTSIAGYAETLLGGTDDATRQQFLDTIHKNAQRMHALVDDLLDLARLESGRYALSSEVIDLEHAMQDAWTPYTRAAADAGIAFSRDILPEAEWLAADPGALRQILGNLFSNAIRHTPPGGSIVCRSAPEDEGVAVAVVDTGAGIPGAHLPRVFERFYRVDPSRSRAAGGTGLGLSIVKHLTEAHGGRVRVESAVGRGTTITCWFPRPPGSTDEPLMDAIT